MILLLEGPDGAGKTTLARSLVDWTGARYHHEGPPPHDDVLSHYGATLEGWRKQGEPVVVDRFARGERVYGPLLRQQHLLDDESWGVMHRLYRASGVIEVLCLPPWEACLASWRRNVKGELVTTEEVLKKSYEAWSRQREESRVLVYDWTRDDPQALLRSVLEGQVSRLVLPPGYCGDPKARVLLVGDRVGDPTRPPDLAFFANHGSSRYLTRALRIGNLQERNLALTNAYKGDGHPRGLLQRNAEGKAWTIVALGRRAHEECLRQGLRSRRVDHPQFWRRFHHHEVQAYADLLRRACCQRPDKETQDE